MKKIAALCLVFFAALFMASCASENSKSDDLITLKEVSALVCENGYTGEDFNNALTEVHRDDIISSWGAPDDTLSGFWGECWDLENADDQFIILCYNDKGYVYSVAVVELFE